MPTANLISGNGGNGLTLTAGTSFNQVIGNSVGLDRFGLPVLPNQGVAILANGTGYNVVVPSESARRPGSKGCSVPAAARSRAAREAITWT